MNNPFRFYYAAGPGDVVGTFRCWREGKPDERQISVTYSEQFFDLARNLGAEAWVVSAHDETDCEKWEGWRVENRPRLPRRHANRWRYFLDQLVYGTRICWDLCRWRPRFAVIAEGTSPWLCFLLPALLGIRIVPALHCVLWAPARPLSFWKRALLQVEGLAFRWGRFTSLCASGIIAEQVEAISRADLPARIFLPTYRKSFFSGVAELAPNEEPFRMLYAGRIEKDKGIFDLIMALRHLEEAVPGSWRLDICGAGTAEGELLRTIEESGLGEVAFSHGHCRRSELLRRIGEAHLLVVPTTSGFVEGFNQVVAEGILAGRPVVATTVCPSAHLFRDAVRIVPPNDPGALGRTILAIRHSPKDHASMTLATAKYRELLYDWSQSWRENLRRIIEDHSLPHATTSMLESCPKGVIGYLVPQFPSQTHAFFWREITALRELGVTVKLISTREPSPGECQHAFAVEARNQTDYVNQIGVGTFAFLLVRFRGVARCLGYLASLKESRLWAKCRYLALIPCAARLAEVARRERLSHVHIHSCADAAHLGALSRLLGGPPFSLTLHGDLPVYGSDHAQKFRHASWVSAVTRPLQRQIVEHTGLPEYKVPVIWMGVNTAEFHPGKIEVPKDGGLLHVVTIARLIAQKGHRYALEAMRVLKEEGIAVRYTIAGSGPAEMQIRDLVSSLGLEGNIELAGNLSESAVRDLLSRADVFLLPSYGLGEAAPVCVMEAMACGLPVISTRIGGTPDMIDHLKDGWLVPQQDAQAIASALRALAQAPETRMRLATAARRTAVRLFDAKISAEKLLSRILPQSRCPGNREARPDQQAA